MDQVGYKRLLLEIDEAKENLQKIRKMRAENVELHTSESTLDNPILFEIASQERQAIWRLNHLLDKKSNARITESTTASDRIGFGSLVKVMFLDDSDATMEVKVVSNSPKEGEVSIQSPIGKALYGRRCGEVISYNVNECLFQAKVMSID